MEGGRRAGRAVGGSMGNGGGRKDQSIGKKNEQANAPLRKLRLGRGDFTQEASRVVDFLTLTATVEREREREKTFRMICINFFTIGPGSVL